MSVPPSLRLLVLVASLLPVSAGFGIYGHITRDTTWADSVFVTGDVVVDSGVTLTIQAGTVVKYTDNLWQYPDRGSTWNTEVMVVGGSLEVQGTSADPVIFADYGPGNTALALYGARARLRSLQIDRFPTGLLASDCPFLLADSSRFGHFGWLSSPTTYSAGTAINILRCDTVVVTDCEFVGVAGGTAPLWQDAPANRMILCRECDSASFSGVTIDSVEGASDWSDLDGFRGSGLAIGVEFSGCRYVGLEGVIVNHVRGGDGHCGSNAGGGSAGYGVVIDASFLQVADLLVKGITGGHGGVSQMGGDVPAPAADAYGLALRGGQGVLTQVRVDSCAGGDGFFYGSDAGSGFGLLWQGDSCWVGKSSFTGCVAGDTIHGKPGAGVGILCRTGGLTIGGSQGAANSILGQSDYGVYNQSPSDVVATYNWWGTADGDSIARLVFDQADSSAVGRVIYEPWLNGPPAVGERADRPGPLNSLVVQPSIGRSFRVQVPARDRSMPGKPSSLLVCDVSGRVVRSLDLPTSGRRAVFWDGRDRAHRILPAGVYFLRLEADGTSTSAKVVKTR